MAWLGACDAQSGMFSTLGLERAGQSAPLHGADANGLLTRGTVVVEAALSEVKRPYPLFGYVLTHPFPRQLLVQALTRRRIAVTVSQNGDPRFSILRVPDLAPGERLRISYAWDSVQGWGRLAVTRLEHGQVLTQPVEAPTPPPLDALEGMMRAAPGRIMATCVTHAAISDEIEPIGPMPGLPADAPILTPGGYVRLGQLQPGDLVLTRTGPTVPILHTASVSVPGYGAFQPIELRAPYLGLEQNIVVAPEQRLVISGSDVEYMFGREAVLVPARHLLGVNRGVQRRPVPVMRYVQLVLPGHEAICVAGTWIESLYLGRLRRHRGRLAASVLAGVRSDALPEHAASVQSVLRRFDAVALAEARAPSRRRG